MKLSIIHWIFVCTNNYHEKWRFIMKQIFSFNSSHPILKSFIITLLFLLIVSIGGAISSIAGISSNITLFIAYFILSLTLAILINRKRNWGYYGFDFTSRKLSEYFIYIPLFIMAVAPLVVGFSSTLTWIDVVYFIFFMAMVAFVEEMIFRGIILKLLQKKSHWIAILGSSLLFSVPHILNALNGKEISQTLFQISFALLLGIILAMLIVKTNRILPLIIYHLINNTLSSITSTNVDASTNLILNIVVLSIGLIYMIYLFFSIKKVLSDYVFKWLKKFIIIQCNNQHVFITMFDNPWNWVHSIPFLYDSSLMI
ncbi:MAG: CPBP family intramembrane metalloprotease [Acholeplasma sp.]|nr:MAG: CPBP family intramembrane metalloprotease [Acholeplasma sp.]